MKSTNRQFYLKTNPAKNYLKMCLLNCILISIMTLTHCLPIPTTLSGAMQKYPKYRDTLLSPEIVPFVNECETNELKPNEKMLCGSYFEMIDKLDHSSLQGLTTVEDFNKAMNVYNPTNIEEFCDKFPGYLPNDPKVYPDSYTLRTRLPDICEGLCSGFDANFAKLVKPICKIYAIGFQLSNAEIQAVQVTNAVTNSTVNLSAEGSLNSGNVRQDTSGSVTLDKGKLSVAVPIVANGTDAAIKPKQVVNLTITKAKDIEVNENIDEKIVDGLGEKTEKDNSSPNSGPALAGISASAGGSASGGGSASAAERLQKINVGESDTNTSPAKSNATETVKQELKTTAKTLNPIENSIPNGETSEKIQTNDEDNAGEDNYTVAIIEKNDIEAGNYNDDDEDDLIEPKPAQLDKSPPQQSNEKLPSDEQLHNEEDPFTDDTDSNFFTYFMFLLLVCVIAYVVYHNKSKMLALMLEGRRSNTGGRGSLSRRKHTAAYRKLDSNLEEAITSSGNGRSTQVIY